MGSGLGSGDGRETGTVSKPGAVCGLRRVGTHSGSNPCVEHSNSSSGSSDGRSSGGASGGRGAAGRSSGPSGGGDDIRDRGEGPRDTGGGPQSVVAAAKAKGNAAYEAGDFRKAMSHYTVGVTLSGGFCMVPLVSWFMMGVASHKVYAPLLPPCCTDATYQVKLAR